VWRQAETSAGSRLELTRFSPFRRFRIIAALLWWLAATGFTQESGVVCSPLVTDRGCETARKGSPGSNDTGVPPAPNRPIVTYSNGKLTITASNASLADVLRAISAQTGTVIDFPAGSAADPIVVREGPDTVRNVLANLLNGSDFNYVIVASPNAPDELERVVLARADQPASPQPASDQPSSPSDQSKTSSSPLLFTPPSGSSLFTPPSGSSLFTSPTEASSAPVLPQALDRGSSEPPKGPTPPAGSEQTMKERTQPRDQVQQPQ
jgi:hypothetical protein